MKQEQMLMIALAFLAGYFLNRLMGREGWSNEDWRAGWPRDSGGVRTIHLGEQVTDWANCNQVAVEYDDAVAVDLGLPALGTNFCNSKAEECISNRISEFLDSGSDLVMANRMAISSCLGTSDTSQYIDSDNGGIIPYVLPEDCDDISELLNKYSAINDACSPGASCSSTRACQMAAYNFGDACEDFMEITGMPLQVSDEGMAEWRAPCSTTPHQHNVHSGASSHSSHRSHSR